ncbi:MAG: YbgA family protein [Nitrospiraceae bacterium]
MSEDPQTVPLRIGISRCLLGDKVRYDGGHKRDGFLTDLLGRYVEWVPVCPEVEAGMGIPREPIHLVGNPRDPRLETIRGADVTGIMTTFSERRLHDLEALELSGFVFKKGSPSCGIERVRVLNRQGMPGVNGVGLFARAFIEHFPLIPVEEEGRLCDPVLRENFIERLFSYHRWRTMSHGSVTRQTIVQFHTIHKYALLAHSRQHYQTLGRLVARAQRFRPTDLFERYGVLFMDALKIKATIRKHVNVLNHIVGHFKQKLAPAERRELDGVIGDYHGGLVPLVVPLTLVKHYVTLHDIHYLRDQVYLNPHPKELMLRNHV